MTVSYTYGDIFKSHARILVCPVNTQGVMGKGLAKAFKERFPGLELNYKSACASGELAIGKPWLWDNPVGNDPRAVLCFATKKAWRSPSQLAWIQQGIEALFTDAVLQQAIINALSWRTPTEITMAFPALGCGLGELTWDAIKPLMTNLDSLPFSCEVLAPLDMGGFTQPQDMARSVKTAFKQLADQRLQDRPYHLHIYHPFADDLPPTYGNQWMWQLRSRPFHKAMWANFQIGTETDTPKHFELNIERYPLFNIAGPIRFSADFNLDDASLSEFGHYIAIAHQPLDNS